MTFIPQTKPDQVIDVPYFDDVTADAGWQGHSTSKTIDTLKSEIVTVIARLGGIVTAFQRGTFHCETTATRQLLPGSADDFRRD